jgi:act minimal PKS acyl carrier protein
MRQFMLDDLRRIVRQCGGEAEAVDLDGDIADMTFEDLGYDSLALIEMSAQIQQEFGVVVSDGAIEHMKTPRATVEYVNELIAQG